jgi:hypothetical protein
VEKFKIKVFGFSYEIPFSILIGEHPSITKDRIAKRVSVRICRINTYTRNSIEAKKKVYI